MVEKDAVRRGYDEVATEHDAQRDEGVEMQWNMAGEATTRDQLLAAGFEVIETWGAPTSLAWDRQSHGGDEQETDDTTDEDDDSPWTFFVARIEE
ncbi:hypothetical protein [Haloarchaeobius sp. DT45]|uniref:hypothetical protein n=1 Tax=Haloarchaeobius sp. DT45 TaxID=3446116 RepID=UPI003F6BA49C